MWRCTACYFVYDPTLGDLDSGIEPGTAFEDLPEDWVCPVCGVGKDMFEFIELEEEEKDEQEDDGCSERADQ